MKYVFKLWSIMLIAILIISMYPTDASLIDEEKNREYNVLVSFSNTGDITRIKSTDAEVIETYTSQVLLRVNRDVEKELNELGLKTTHLRPRTILSMKRHPFGFEGEKISFLDEITIEDYEPGVEGLFIIHLMGPPHPRWWRKLDDLGVNIINYVPNYAYEVKMTPELAEEVVELYFVDRVEVYQPAFKLAEDLKTGLVSIRLTEGARLSTFEIIDSKLDVISVTETAGYGTIILVEARDKTVFSEIVRLPEVYRISNHAEPDLTDEIASQIIGGGCWIWDPYDDPYEPYRGHGDHGAYVNQLGYTGRGVTTAIADTGIGDGTAGNAGHLDFDGRVIGGHYWSGNTWADGHGHGTHVAGSLAGNTYNGTSKTIDEFGYITSMGEYYAAQGLAYNSDIYGQKIFDDDGDWIGPSTYFEIIEEAKQNAGAYVHSNSWGDDTSMGSYTDASEDYDRAVRDANRESDNNEPMIIVTAAGNEGGSGIVPPGTAKNVITVGSTENFNPDMGVDDPESISDFSSRGWTDDMRIKPDLVAPGEGIISTGITSDDSYESRSGTSMAVPAVAGAAAVVVEWYEDNYGYTPSPAMVKSLMINTAYSLQGETGAIPNRHEGWGMVNLVYLIGTDLNFIMEDQTSSLTTGEVDEYYIEYQDNSEPLKVSLVWTDKEALSGDIWALKNNLNLEVIAPNGDTFRGNAFHEGWTSPNKGTMDDFDINNDGWDDVNNVQNVYIHQDDLETGTYKVRIHGELISMDSNNDGYINQDYALVIQNAYEKIPPSISLNAPDGGEVWYAGMENEISWETERGDGDIEHIDLDYSIDGGHSWEIIGTGLEDTGTYLWEVPDEPSMESLVRVTVYDEADISAFDISNDTFAIIGTEQTHTIEIINPLEGDLLSSEDILLEWAVEEGLPSIDKHEVSIGYDLWIEAHEGDRHTFTNIEEGDHKAMVRVTDEYGYSVEKSVNFIVDTTPPDVEITRPQEGEIYQRQEVKIEWVTTPHNTDVVEYHIRKNEGQWGSADYENEHTYSDLEDGYHTVFVRAVDEAGNTGEANVSFIVDTIAPDIKISSPVQGHIEDSGDVLVTWDVTPHTTDITVFEVSVDGENFVGSISDTGHTFTGLVDGEYTLFVRVQDQAGHIGEDQVSIIVDTTPPEIIILTPDHGDILDSREVEVRWDVTPHNTEIVSYEVSLDGESWIGSDSDSGHFFRDLEDGKHTVYVRVLDEAGHVGEDRVDFRIDTVSQEGINILWSVFYILMISLVSIVIMSYIFLRQGKER